MMMPLVRVTRRAAPGREWSSLRESSATHVYTAPASRTNVRPSSPD
jgi:hypothetical protein